MECRLEMRRMTSAAAGEHVGEQEPGRTLGEQRVRVAPAQPDRCRHDHDCRRPGDGIEDETGPRGAEGVREEVGGVPEDVESHPGGQKDPGHLAPAGQHRESAHHQTQEEHVPDRIGEVGQRGDGASGGRPLDAVEGEGGTHGGSTTSGDGSVQPIGGGDLLDFPPDEEHHPDVGQRVEQEVKDVSRPRAGWRSPTQRLDGQHHVAHRPRQQAESEEKGSKSTGSSDEAPGDAQHAGDQLDPAHHPTVEPGPRLVVAA